VATTTESSTASSSPGAVERAAQAAGDAVDAEQPDVERRDRQQHRHLHDRRVSQVSSCAARFVAGSESTGRRCRSASSGERCWSWGVLPSGPASTPSGPQLLVDQELHVVAGDARPYCALTTSAIASTSRCPVGRLRPPGTGAA
jgi:hypothetical protein